ncbi:unnamed protein product [Didymodactylos carnosus]|uniref:Uncharacterized protein n=1 Tax=Didymodactylos carnosus TaxID=1234261 RepID=A0A814JWI5_9BILA|nr:unnamed protein product [Didymodactylos carnosus]CAF1044127.1 unnamed protein product [Didymodactylos carnosus]CAF3785765.1 unnamed protein product [Didymodactylos carnosus]CAF3814169.1 unnamed protein product [Didymodactylos carnosus]
MLIDQVGAGCNLLGSLCDEQKSINGSCLSQKKYRFQCSTKESTCLMVNSVGNSVSDCTNGLNEYTSGEDSLLSNMNCYKRFDFSCRRLKNYIEMFSLTETSNYTNISTTANYVNINQMAFDFYYDTFFDSDRKGDEMNELCQDRLCDKDHFQCPTGQCIQFKWVCDGTQYPCLLANVSNALNFDLYPPCINLTQIGDGRIDCIGRQDETVLQNCRSPDVEIGFYCGNSANNYCVSPERLCEENIKCNNSDLDKICYYRKLKYTSKCLEGHRYNGDCLEYARCYGEREWPTECLHLEVDYWCGDFPQQPTDYRQ